ncbi:cryptochrome/photolyase family protein [Novosphingobium sp.]|uniref:cryptochrome/photolyase family protein n=1 Tax=Novosphingobium sp. TaxID=1874826 RepID=UPI00286AF6B0|nr:cryptochrome/photolyase family protein [Novosphingobium sp.]
MTQPVLIPVLGDQLSHRLASLVGSDPAGSVVLMMEVRREAAHVKHHKSKIALIFSAMRHFAAELREAGWTVDYVALDHPDNTGSFAGELARAVDRHKPHALRLTEPSEWRVREDVAAWSAALGLPVEVLEDDRFLCTHGEFAHWAENRREWRMEYFYREMRRKTGLLMDGDHPEGGRWNFDAENRSGPSPGLRGPALPRFAPDATTTAVLALVEREFADHFGALGAFNWPASASEAEAAAEAFLSERLPIFGQWQDAMVAGEDFMFHAVLSPAINLGLLDPLDLCRRAEAEYRKGNAPLAAVEGFIRQIIGWREYIRGVYWQTMPGLATANALDARRPLPDFYWTGATDMACIADCVRTTRDNAYAHHIQRLMVLGNFALLAGLDPGQVADWFLVVYADAFDWVELPNVAGMALFADGGRLASKPYAASGAYINRMSNYCASCRYDVKKKTGPDACPFNALYWHFLDRNAPTLAANRRLANPYATWRRIDAGKRGAYIASADAFLDTLDPARPGWARGGD